MGCRLATFQTLQLYPPPYGIFLPMFLLNGERCARFGEAGGGGGGGGGGAGRGRSYGYPSTSPSAYAMPVALRPRHAHRTTI